MSSIRVSAILLLLIGILHPGGVRAQDEQPLVTLQGHSAFIHSIAFCPDGTLLASASDDKTVKLWDPAAGKDLRTLRGHTSLVLSVAFSPDGKRLASGSDDKTVRVWDPATGKSVAMFKGHTNGVTSVAFSPEGKLLASASADKTVRIWDAGTGQLERTFAGHTAFVFSIAFSPDGKWAASADGNSVVKVWDPATGKEYGTLKGRSVCISPDGKQIATTDGTNPLRIWRTPKSADPKNPFDLMAFQESGGLKGHTAWVNALTYNPDGTMLASGGGEVKKPGELVLWDAEKQTKLQMRKAHLRTITAVAFHPKEKQLATASGDATVKIWKLPN